MTVGLVGYHGLCQDHNVEAVNLYQKDGLIDTKPLSAVDVVGSDG